MKCKHYGGEIAINLNCCWSLKNDFQMVQLSKDLSSSLVSKWMTITAEHLPGFKWLFSVHVNGSYILRFSKVWICLSIGCFLKGKHKEIRGKQLAQLLLNGKQWPFPKKLLVPPKKRYKILVNRYLLAINDSPVKWLQSNSSTAFELELHKRKI